MTAAPDDDPAQDENIFAVVADHEARLQQLEAGPQASGQSTWEKLAADPDGDIDERWANFRTWVAWLQHTYPAAWNDIIRPCWTEHSDLTYELTGLWLAHLGATSNDALPGALMDWHNSASLARERLKKHDWSTAVKCTRGGCELLHLNVITAASSDLPPWIAGRSGSGLQDPPLGRLSSF